MSNYLSSFWRSMSSGWSSRGGTFRIGDCGCRTACSCQAGSPCRCRKSCGCSSSGAKPSWLESAETQEGELQGEFGRHRGFASRAPVRSYAPRSYAARAAASRAYPARPYAARSWQRPGVTRYGVRPGFDSAAPYRYAQPRPGFGQPRIAGHSPTSYFSRARSFLGNHQAQRNYWTPRQQWNNTFGNRYGSNRFSGGIGRMIGCPGCAPGSRQFSNSLAHWQSRLGLRPTGMMTPGLWNWMRRRLPPPGAGATPGPYDSLPPPMDAAPPPPAPEPQPPVEPAAEPATDANDAPADAPPEAAAAPDAPADGDAAAAEEYGVGFRGRRHPRRQRHYSVY